MKSMSLMVIVLAALLVALGNASPARAQKKRPQAQPTSAAAPIAAARRLAIDARPFHRPLDAERIRKWMEISSTCTMAEFELFLAPLSTAEKKLAAKIETMPQPIVNRLHFDDLRGVLKNGGLLSLHEEEKLRGSNIKHTTPAVENELYGAFDCVFASVGPPDGSPQYGDVIIRLKDSVRENGWATPFSGMHFLYAIRGQDARKMQELLAAGKPLPSDPGSPLSLGFDDRLHFSHYVVTERHWHQALAYQAVLVLRNAGKSPAGDRVRERFEQLLSADDPETFWKLFIPAREQGISAAEAAARAPFGYLEAKFPDKLSIEDFTSIEVSADKLDQVRAWPEAKPYAQLIRAKPQNTP